jgi:uncharacterized protein (TIGR02996 family)
LAFHRQYEQFLKEIAERPEDRALRLVFSDYLIERSDPRGEVILLSLKPALSLSERRRLLDLTALHGASWLGAMRGIVNPSLCRFTNGFPSSLSVKHLSSDDEWGLALTEPTGGTVNELHFPANFSLAQRDVVTSLLKERAWPHLRLMSAGSVLWNTLELTPSQFDFTSVGLISYGLFGPDVVPTERAALFFSAPALECTTFELVNARVAQEIVSSFQESRTRINRFTKIGVHIQFGAVEGVAALVTAFLASPSLEAQHFSVRYNELKFEFLKQGALTVEMGRHLGALGLGGRIGVLVSVLVLLAPLKLKRLELLFAEHSRLQAGEIDAIQAALRRLKTIESFSIAGVDRAGS